MAELIKIYHENGELKGTLPREKVHQLGEWHHTFQCLFIDKDNIYLQKRSKSVSSYVGKYDITIGGHLLENETIIDGCREIEEELGVLISANQLKLLCMIPESLADDEYLDNEFINIFICEVNQKILSSIKFNDNEVDDLIRVNIKDFIQFCLKPDFILQGSGITKNEIHNITRDDFIPYSNSYFAVLGHLL
ncbi:NUDIX domain-containing protein [Macrococcus sp. DPC7161]|uniref:NUDIX hydrolase n=1 Tax=Macrococcus sp. DPC7161 TaxID=2507060 RepID=UPI00100A8433|nr:NUDIX domain-containing protein [Macrococcus sp. DPC7161]RXK19176.1 NUDIX domain-containing protein [Macrococcus sp. DPC7161]